MNNPIKVKGNAQRSIASMVAENAAIHRETDPDAVNMTPAIKVTSEGRFRKIEDGSPAGRWEQIEEEAENSKDNNKKSKKKDKKKDKKGKNKIKGEKRRSKRVDKKDVPTYIGLNKLIIRDPDEAGSVEIDDGGKSVGRTVVDPNTRLSGAYQIVPDVDVLDPTVPHPPTSPRPAAGPAKKVIGVDASRKKSIPMGASPLKSLVSNKKKGAGLAFGSPSQTPGGKGFKIHDRTENMVGMADRGFGDESFRSISAHGYAKADGGLLENNRSASMHGRVKGADGALAGDAEKRNRKKKRHSATNYVDMGDFGVEMTTLPITDYEQLPSEGSPENSGASATKTPDYSGMPKNPPGAGRIGNVAGLPPIPSGEPDTKAAVSPP